MILFTRLDFCHYYFGNSSSVSANTHWTFMHLKWSNFSRFLYLQLISLFISVFCFYTLSYFTLFPFFFYCFQTLKSNVSVEDSKKQKKQILEFENDLYAIRQENENNLSTSAKEYKSTKNEIEKLKIVDAKLENDLSALQSLHY